MRTTRGIIVATVLALAVIAPGAGADPLEDVLDPGCWYPTADQSDAVHVNGFAGSGDLVCTYAAAGRGGVSGLTLNAWEVYAPRASGSADDLADGTQDGRIVFAASARGTDAFELDGDGPVQSLGDRVVPGETVYAVLFADADGDTDGTLRTGGPGVAPQ